MKNLFLIKAITVLIFCTTATAHASWMSDAWDEMVTSNSTSGSAINRQGSMGYSGGSYTLSSKRTTVQPFSVRAPSYSAGCSGISFDMGAFQYNFEDLINFVKNIGTAAPGYALQLALQILCPSCTDLMNTLNELSSMINGMQLDSCNALNAAGNFLQEKLASSSAKEYIGTGSKSYFNEAIKTIDTGLQTGKNEIKNILKCYTAKRIYCDTQESFFAGEITLLTAVQTVLKSEYTGTHSDFISDENINLLRGFIGDIKLEKEAGKGTDDNSQNLSVRFMTNYGYKPEEIVNLLTYGNQNKQLPMYSVPSYIILGITNNDEVKNIIRSSNMDESKVHLDLITSAFQHRTGLNEQTLKFLAAFRSPVYKVIDSYSIDTQALELFINNFKPLAGVQLTYEYLALTSREVLRVVSEYEKSLRASKLLGQDLEESLNQIKRRLRDIQKAAYDEYLIAYAEFDEKLTNAEAQARLINMNKAVMARHPIMGSSTFGRMGVGQ